VSSIPQGLPSLIIPDPTLICVNILLTLAATVFLVSYVEGYSFASDMGLKTGIKLIKTRNYWL